MRRRFMKKSEPLTYHLEIQTKANSIVRIGDKDYNTGPSGLAHFYLKKGTYEYYIINSNYMIRSNIVDIKGMTNVTVTDLNPIPNYYADISIYNSNGTHGYNPGSNPIGVLVDCSQSSFILSLKCFGRGYGDCSSNSVSGLQNTNTENVLSDFNGKSNFSRMVSRSSCSTNNGYVIGKINTFSDGNIGAGQWYLPSGGQICIVKQYYNEIMSACNRCGFYPNISHIIYTSTKCANVPYAPHENTDESVFAPDIYNDNPINERNVRISAWGNIYYWAVADKP